MEDVFMIGMSENIKFQNTAGCILELIDVRLSI